MNASNIDDDYFRPPSHLSLQMVGLTGVAAFIVNVFILTIFFYNKHLRNSSALLIALNTGHALNGAIHTFVGFWTLVHDGTTFVPITYCVVSMWPAVFISIYQLLPLMLFLNAVERLLGSTVPVWYHKHCSHRREWSLVAVIGALGVVFIIENCIKGWFNDGPPIVNNCIPNQVFGDNYMLFGVQNVAVTCGVLATVCTSVAVHCAKRKLAGMPMNSVQEFKRARRQFRLTQCLLMICVIDVICVVVPNLLLQLHSMGAVDYPMRYAYYLVITYCSDSVWNIAAFLIFNAEFRNSVRKLIIPCKKTTGDPQLFVSSQKSPRVARDDAGAQ